MITLLDGSCGSRLWAFADEAGINKDPTWKYNIEHPELVLRMHKGYIDAGSDMIQTNTFAVNRASVARSSSYTVEEVISSSVKLASQAAAGTNVKVYLSSGPLTQLLEPFGKLTKEECADVYSEIFSSATSEGIDTIMLETFMDLEMMKIAAAEAKKTGAAVIASMTFEKRNRTMMGNTISQICSALGDIGVDAVGMNCSKGPVDGLKVIEEFHNTTSLPLYFKPNSGMGDNYSSVDFADEVEPALKYVSYVGGCCGTDENYIRELKRRIVASR